MADHEYQPHPDTGKCVVCAVKGAFGRGQCRWCGHVRAMHDGVVDPIVLKRYETTILGPGNKPVKSSSVKWTPTACAAEHCACRTYEI